MSVEHPSASVERFLLVFTTVLHSIAAIMTFARLWVRLRRHRLWWEDAWAFLALFFDVICAVTTWILSFPQRAQPWYLSREAHIISMWLALVSFTCSIWAARMSIMFSLIRMTHSGRMRNITSGFTAFFFFLWALCAASKAYTCGSDRSWYNLPDFQCPLGVPIAVIELTTDVVSDIILVSLPARILYRMRLPRNERILILSIFSMSLLNVIVSIVHLTFLIPNPGFVSDITADIEMAVDLMNCNLLVLVTTLYRFFRNGEDIENTENYHGFAQKPPQSSSLRTARAMNTLTTVDLEGFATMTINSTRSEPIPWSEEVPIQTVSSRSCVDVRSGGPSLSFS